MQFDRDTYTITDPGRFGRVMLALGVAGLVISAVGPFVNARQFFYSYLLAFAFWTTIGFGGLFFTMVHHLTNSTWSVVIRRISEAVMITLPVMVLFAVPFALGVNHIYIWTDKAYVAADPVLVAKAAYLNPGFFIVRLIFYLLLWSFLAWMLHRASVEQDAGWNPERAKRFLRISAPGTIAFALTVSFAGFDWLMSLQPHWYSTIYGVYFFSGGIVSIMAFFAIAENLLNRRGVLVDEVTVEHRHDIAKLMFAFLIFWGYMALSQYLLIWYADLPEETAFFKARWIGSWKVFSVMIAVGGFTVPFVMLMGRAAKRSSSMLMFFAFYLLAMHWVDLYWNIMPPLHPEGAVFSWMDLTTFVGIGGIFLSLFWRNFTKYPVLPVTDPKLGASLQFVNQ